MSDKQPKKATKPRAKKIKQQDQPLNFPNDYWIFAADLSLRRPGLFRVCVHRDENGTLLTECAATSIDNKSAKLKTRGEILDDILYGMGAFCPRNDAEPDKQLPVFYVREKAFNSRGAMNEIGIFEVVGIADFWAWQHKKAEWQEVYPVTVKRLVTGDSKADKTKVANYLKLYIGDTHFSNDDESDAAAVAIAFLIQNNQMENKLTKETD